MIPCDEYHPDPDLFDDDGAQAQLASERHEAVVAALYECAMRGVPEEELMTLCAETGVKMAEVRGYTPPVLRMPRLDSDMQDHVCIGNCPF